MELTDLEKAREWANTLEQSVLTPSEQQSAAMQVIQSLPDQWIDAEKVREIIVHLRADMDFNPDLEPHVEALESLLPAPPTLADMTPEERERCQWMQAQTWHEVGIILWVDEASEIAQLITRASGVLERKFKDVIPLPDLPKLEWPGGVEDALIVDGEPTLPRPEDVPSGEAWLIAYEGGFHTALKADDGDDGEPWIVSFTPGGAFLWLSDRDVTLISRLVPEHKENA